MMWKGEWPGGERCQHVACRRRATTREAWRIDDATVEVWLCGEHAFRGAAPRLVSGERWATRTRLAP